MRASIVIAVSVAGLVAGTMAASAADLEVETSGYDRCCTEYGPDRVVIYDDQPGVTMRRWWLPPWRNRHYYPHGRWARKNASRAANDGKSVARQQPRRAPSYARHWTNPPADVDDAAQLLSADTPLPRENPYRNMPPVMVVPTVR